MRLFVEPPVRSFEDVFRQSRTELLRTAYLIVVEEHPRANGTRQVIVFSLLADDSVAEVRYELSFATHNDGTWRLTSASWSERCRPRRGHQEFTTAFCI